MTPKKVQENDPTEPEDTGDLLPARFVVKKRKIKDEEQEMQNAKQQNANAAASDDAVGPVADKIIYTNLDDEVTDLVGLLKNTPNKNISLIVPHRAIIFKSSVNLHILHKKALEFKKEVTIISHDEAGVLASQHVGFKTKKELSSLKKKTESIAQENAFMRGEKPARITREKKSIAEVINPEEKVAAFDALLSKIKDKIQKKRSALKGTHLVFITPNKQALFTLVLVSILLFLSIAYIALPGATITITPRESVLESTFNVSFLDYVKNRQQFDENRSPNLIVPTYPVTPPVFTKTYQHIPTGKISKGDRATGIVTVYNTADKPWDLAATTRFQTKEGLIFRTPQAVRVPSGNIVTPGTVDIQIVADDIDTQNQVIGSRGNIEASRFFLPGLQEESRSKLYAESKTPFSGGVTTVIKVVTQEDLDAAIETFKKKIAQEAPDELKNYLEQENLAKKTNNNLITDKNVLKISEPTITTPPNLVGQQVDQFELTASYTLSSIAYDKSVLVKQLRDRLIHRVDPDKKVVRVSDSDLSYRYLEQDVPSGRVKLTVTMRAIQTFDLDPENENGKRFVKKITDHILGLRIDSAKDFLRQQTDEIAQVEVKTWPIWAPTIPNIADNIKFVVQENAE